MSQRASMIPARTLTRGTTVLAAPLLLIAAHHFGLLQLVSEPEQARQAILGLGALGLVAFVVAYAFLQPLGVSGVAFVLAAPLIWPWPIAFAVSMSGTLAASVVGFSLARFVARDWMTKRIPARFRTYEGPLARRGFATVAALRLVFLMMPMLHALFGISRVGFWTHLGASAVGYVVPLFVISYYGDEAFELLRGAPLSAWAGLAAAVLAVAVGRLLMRRHGRRRHGSAPDMTLSNSKDVTP
ncbi:VTT domain-containing protein [Myxococcus sp. SDU36]|uniref:TVP38/TMEM64 family protein n=1 Tax=Myxococcus sp. SDU36 TaxID=2831967 RepID=UPI002542FD38|nr:VTT domain-containing protein [Myxococcus sp. SDU36]WIG98838.1 VTT domain-containing protein [Myxococcus sp. SDU36]